MKIIKIVLAVLAIIIAPGIALVAVLFAICLYPFLIIGLVLTRGSTDQLIEDLGLSRHIYISWFIVPLFRIYFWLLEATDKLVITVNAPIPWGEKRLIFTGNHDMPKLQDTFLMPPIIFYRNISKVRNPIRYFPWTIADEGNFFNNVFFKFIVGKYFVESVNRAAAENQQTAETPKSFRSWRKRLIEMSIFLIANIEGGRTQSAKDWLTSEKGSRLGAPTRGTALLALSTNTPIVPYWGRIVGVSYWKFSPQALFWKFLELIFSSHWEKIGFYTARPKASPQTVLWGLMELFFNPGIRAFIDINHPEGHIKPKIREENARKLTVRTAKTLLELGDYQLERIQQGRKK